MSKETSKAMRRRWIEDAKGEFPWREIFQGRGIDVGSGDDLLPFEGCQPFDMEHGDANHLLRYFKHESFDYLHSSQSLEHMHNPVSALSGWMEVVRPGGWLVITVPSWELYEGMVWPSRYNPDHKSTWSMSLRGSPAPIHICVPEFVEEIPGKATARLIDTNYDYLVGAKRDQTLDESDGVEAFIEIVIRKVLL